MHNCRFMFRIEKVYRYQFISIDAYNYEKTINFNTKNLFEVLQYPKNKNKLTLLMYRDLCQNN